MSHSGPASEVKHDLLGVPPGPVVSEEAVDAMVRATASLLGADLAVALSGAGGTLRGRRCEVGEDRQRQDHASAESGTAAA